MPDVWTSLTFCPLVFVPCPGQLLDRRAALIDKAAQRRKLLEDSYRYQQFDRDADEVEAWIKEKLKGTSDDSYKVRRGFVRYFISQ